MKHKNILLKQFFAFLCLSIFGVQAAYATAKTLPKGVFKFDLYKANYEIVKGGANPSGDLSTWVTRDAGSLTMGDFYSFQLLNSQFNDAVGAGLLPANPINLDTLLVNKWVRNRTHLDIAYGVSDKVTIFANITHEVAEADYTDAYTATSEAINDILTLQGNGDAYNSAPDKASSNHLRDTYIGLKYAIKPNLSITARGTGGFLLTGVDSNEKDFSDGVQELETGSGYSTVQLFANYDVKTKVAPLFFTAGYIFNGEGPQTFLDNSSVDIDYGNMIYLKLGSEYRFHPTVILEGSLEHIIVSADKYKGSATSTFGSKSATSPEGAVPTTYTPVPGSAGYATIANLGLRVTPKQFLHFFFRLSKPIKNQTEGQVYDFPGRLEPGLKMSIGTTFFFKTS